jgi:hypothetical protein
VSCPAKAALTAEEADRMNALSDADFEADTDLRPCEFPEHGPEVLHTLLVQTQHTSADAPGTAWWLQWSDDGRHAVLVGPECRKSDGNEDCLLIQDHPGDCFYGVEDQDDGSGWTLVYVTDDREGCPAWELREGGLVLYDNDEFDATQVEQARTWAAEALLEGEELTVSGWTADPSLPGRWIAEGS